MRVVKKPDSQPCEVVVAQFVFAPVYCTEPTHFVIAGREVRICIKHIEEARRLANKLGGSQI